VAWNSRFFHGSAREKQFGYCYHAVRVQWGRLFCHFIESQCAPDKLCQVLVEADGGSFGDHAVIVEAEDF